MYPISLRRLPAFFLFSFLCVFFFLFVIKTNKNLALTTEKAYLFSFATNTKMTESRKQQKKVKKQKCLIDFFTGSVKKAQCSRFSFIYTLQENKNEKRIGFLFFISFSFFFCIIFNLQNIGHKEKNTWLSSFILNVQGKC